MKDDLEIEKKWLIDKTKIPYDLNDPKNEVFEIEQTYICFDPEIRVRRINGNEYTFAVKTHLTENGLQRNELEDYITEEAYNNMVVKKEGNTIYKTRYQFLDEEGQLIAIDIFKGDLEGLAYMEIEFANKEEADKYQTPSWVIKDVTADVRYKNGHLARYGIPE